MDSTAEDTITLVAIPSPGTNEMVQFICSQMDQLFASMQEVVPFTTGDVMSACLCIMVEAGKVGRKGDLDGLKNDLLQSVEVAIAHYGRPDRKDQH